MPEDVCAVAVVVVNIAVLIVIFVFVGKVCFALMAVIVNVVLL